MAFAPVEVESRGRGRALVFSCEQPHSRSRTRVAMGTSIIATPRFHPPCLRSFTTSLHRRTATCARFLFRLARRELQTLRRRGYALRWFDLYPVLPVAS
jgi:hypothetical protein